MSERSGIPRPFFVVESDREAPLTSEQVRAARRLLGWSRVRLASRTGVSHATALARYEDGKGRSRYLDLAKVRSVLEAAGVIFVDDDGEGSGVRFDKPAR
jgi:transcriptional regulator with XRE-family HTH domain